MKFDVSNSLGSRAIVSFTFSKEGYNRYNVLKDGDMVIDIGAYIGDFAVLAAKVGTNIKVYAYEPLQRSFEYLQRNILLNNMEKQIIPFKLGVEDIMELQI